MLSKSLEIFDIIVSSEGMSQICHDMPLLVSG